VSFDTRALRRKRFVACPLLAIVAAGLAVPQAQAHSGSAVRVLDYEATVAPPGPELRGVRASVQGGDRKLRLTVAPDRRVVVLGDAEEPFLAFSDGGVAVNSRSQTAISAGLASDGARLTLDPHASPDWTPITSGHAFAWHEHRLAPPLPRGVKSRAWSIPVVVDGAPARLSGEYRRIARPALWPWLLFAALIFGLAAIVRVVGFSLTTAAVGWSVLAACSALATVTGFALGEPYGGRSAYIELGAALALALAGAAALAVFRDRRAAVAGILGLLAVVAGLGAAGVFFHGLVVSALPAVAVRVAATIALCGGLSAAALSLGEAGHSPRARPQRRVTRWS
jgi:hypothetical protein